MPDPSVTDRDMLAADAVLERIEELLPPGAYLPVETILITAFARHAAGAATGRDREIADYLDDWAAKARARRRDDGAAAVARAVEALASSIRAGLAGDDGTAAP